MKSIKCGLGSSKKKLREVVSPNCFGRDMGANLVAAGARTGGGEVGLVVVVVEEDII